MTITPLALKERKESRNLSHMYMRVGLDYTNLVWLWKSTFLLERTKLSLLIGAQSRNIAPLLFGVSNVLYVVDVDVTDTQL